MAGESEIAPETTILDAVHELCRRNKNMHFDATALDTLCSAAEQYLLETFVEAALVAAMAQRDSVTLRDIRLARRMLR